MYLECCTDPMLKRNKLISSSYFLCPYLLLYILKTKNIYRISTFHCRKFSKTNLICFVLWRRKKYLFSPYLLKTIHFCDLYIFFSNQSHLPCLCLLPRSSPPPSGGRHHKQFQSDVFEIAERYFDVYPQCYFNHTNISQYFISNQPICWWYFDVNPKGLL